jgi:type IV secretory pathway VirB9-like protein
MTRLSFILLVACGSLMAADDDTQALAARTFTYSEKDIVRVRAKVKFTTIIALPKSEAILDFICGDKEFWIVNGNQNFAYVKPAKEKSSTNLNLITASGNVYSFLLTEIGDTGGEPDLKVFIEPREESMLAAASAAPRFVNAQQVEDYRQQVEIAKAETREARQAAQTAIEREAHKFQSEYPLGLKFAYRFEAQRKPFQVSAIYHDGKFTYIQANPQETPALYEVKDGKPNLIEFQFKSGTYVVNKILDNGYLAIGKQKLGFTRSE